LLPHAQDSGVEGAERKFTSQNPPSENKNKKQSKLKPSGSWALPNKSIFFLKKSNS
jgi:hypothetical protein